MKKRRDELTRQQKVALAVGGCILALLFLAVVVVALVRRGDRKSHDSDRNDRLGSGTLAPVVTNRAIERAYEVRLMIASRAHGAAP